MIKKTINRHTIILIVAFAILAIVGAVVLVTTKHTSKSTNTAPRTGAASSTKTDKNTAEAKTYNITKSDVVCVKPKNNPAPLFCQGNLQLERVPDKQSLTYLVTNVSKVTKGGVAVESSAVAGLLAAKPKVVIVLDGETKNIEKLDIVQ